MRSLPDLVRDFVETLMMLVTSTLPDNHRP
jgi:hypothetical protein